MTADVGLDVFVSEEDASIYVKISGFECYEYAEQYAEHLSTYLPLMLFESEVIH